MIEGVLGEVYNDDDREDRHAIRTDVDENRRDDAVGQKSDPQQAKAR